MAEYTKAHLWLNTAVACLALAASSGSAIFSWRSYQLKRESIGFIARTALDCKVQYQKFGDAGLLGLCWMVTITNQSESRTSIVTHQVFSLINGARSFHSGFTEVESVKGETTQFPIILDGGEAKSYLVRAPFDIPPPVVKVVEGILVGRPSQVFQLSDFQRLLFHENLDLIGNHVTLKYLDAGAFAASWDSNQRFAVAQAQFETGRGNAFVVQMSYPPSGF
jgi:hypothetical protein